jgi:hypothetical protein
MYLYTHRFNAQSFAKTKPKEFFSTAADVYSLRIFTTTYFHGVHHNFIKLKLHPSHQTMNDETRLKYDYSAHAVVKIIVTAQAL